MAMLICEDMRHARFRFRLRRMKTSQLRQMAAAYRGLIRNDMASEHTFTALSIVDSAIANANERRA